MRRISEMTPQQPSGNNSLVYQPQYSGLPALEPEPEAADELEAVETAAGG